MTARQDEVRTPVVARTAGRPDADLPLRRAILLAVKNGGVLQDQIDCAELAFDGGLFEVAEILYGLVFLQAGFSAAGLALQRAAVERTDLWRDLAPGADFKPTEGFSVDLAVAELKDLMRLRPVLPPARRRIPEMMPALVFTVAERRPDADGPLIGLARTVASALRAVPRLAAHGGLTEMLKEQVEAVMALRPIRLHEHLGLDIATFAAFYALDRMRQFLLTTDDLLNASSSVLALFDAAARLDPAALGPYFSNLRYVIRDAGDIFALIQIAGDRPSSEEIEGWCVLMSGYLSGGQTLDLVDELADRGLRRALATLLARIARASALNQPRDIVWRIRDAGLDIGDLGLAEDAQFLVALWTPTNATEWMVLGDIRAAAGDPEAAEAAYGRVLTLHPKNGELEERLSRLRAGVPAPITRGFGTSPARLRLRRARLEAFSRAAS